MNKVRCDNCGKEFTLTKRKTIFIFDLIDSQRYMLECPHCKAIILSKVFENRK